MIRSTPALRRPLLVLLVALCTAGFAGCGDDAGEDAHPVAGLWFPVAPRLPSGAPPPGFLRFGSDGMAEQYDGRRVYRGAWSIEGEQIVLTAVQGMPPAPPMLYSIEDGRLTLMMTTAQGKRPLILRRADVDAPPGDNNARFRRLAGRFAEALTTRIAEAGAARSRERGRGEVVQLGSAEKPEGGLVTGSLVVPWTLNLASGKPRTGELRFAMVWLNGAWRLLRARLADDADGDAPGADLVTLAPSGEPNINEDSPFSAVVWQAWLDATK